MNYHAYAESVDAHEWLKHLRSLIMCAQCGKPIERLEMQQDLFSRATVFTAYCHGEMEDTVLNHADVAGAIISPGIAFREIKIKVPA